MYAQLLIGCRAEHNMNSQYVVGIQISVTNAYRTGLGGCHGFDYEVS